MKNFDNSDFLNTGSSCLYKVSVYRSKSLPKFYKFGFLNNEVNYGSKFTRTALAKCNYSFNAVDAEKKRKVAISTISFFFNPLFKFSFVFSQNTGSENYFLPKIGKKYRIEVLASWRSFIAEQENNYYLHYSYRAAAFSNFYELNSLRGGQSLSVFSSIREKSYSDFAAKYFSADCKTIRDFYHKSLLSSFNCMHNIYKTLYQTNKDVRMTAHARLNNKFSLKLRRFKKWAVWRQKKIGKILHSEEHFKKKRGVFLLRKFLNLLPKHWFRFKKMHRVMRINRLLYNKIGTKPIYRRRRRRKLPDYVNYSIINFLRLKAVTGTNVYNKAFSNRNDLFGCVRFLKRAAFLAKDRFKKKKQRSPTVRVVRKSFTSW